MRLAADYWTRARRGGHPTAPDPLLDPDVILAAQASVLAKAESDVVVATTNVGHLSRFVAAKHRREVRWARKGRSASPTATTRRPAR
jgi:hypothetical protein